MNGTQKLELFKKRIREEIITKYPKYKEVKCDGKITTLDNSFDCVVTDIGFGYEMRNDEDIDKIVLKSINIIYDEIVFNRS